MNTLISEKKLQPLPIISEGDLIYASFEELTALLDTGHWTNTRKKLVVKAVMAKMVSLSQIRERYGIDNFEIYCWCHNFGLGDRIHDGLLPSVCVRADTQPTSNSLTGRLSVGKVEVDFDTHKILADTEPIYLSKSEFKFFEYLILKSLRGCVATHEGIMIYLYKDKEEVPKDFSIIKVFMARMRKKFYFAGAKPLNIELVHGRGYRIRDKFEKIR